MNKKELRDSYKTLGATLLAKKLQVSVPTVYVLLKRNKIALTGRKGKSGRKLKIIIKNEKI